MSGKEHNVANIYTRIVPRSGRLYQPLKYSLIKRGIEQSPAYLFNLDRCNCILNAGELIYEHVPTLEFQAAFPKEHTRHFIANVNKFDQDIAVIRNIAATIQELLDSGNWAELINYCKQGFDVIYRYIFLAQYIDETYAEELLESVSLLPEHIRSSLLANALSSDFTKWALEYGMYPGTDKRFSNILPPIVLWSGRIRNSNVLDIDSVQVDWLPDAFPPSTRRLALLSHYVYQCAEAFGFAANLITTTSNWVFNKTATLLIERGRLKRISEIYELDISKVEEYLSP